MGIINNYSYLANPAVLPVAPYQPGQSISNIKKEFGLREVVKLASNENPLGPSPLAVRAIQAILQDINFYPDDSGLELKEALATTHRVETEEIVLGHGATDILEIIAKSLLCSGDEIVYAHPTFPWFQILGQLNGAHSVVVPLHQRQYDLALMLRSVGPKTKLIFIANPNNPTGTYIRRNSLVEFLDALPPHVITVLDEAYIDYVTEEDPGPLPARFSDRVILVRTFSKTSGLAGLRIGYAVTHREIADLLQRSRQPFNTTAIAHVAAVASLHDQMHREKTRQVVVEGKDYLYRQFRQLGLDFYPSEANFIFVDFHSDSKRISEKLTKRGFLIRQALQTCSRITVGSMPQNIGLVRALDRVLQEVAIEGAQA